MTHVNAFKSDLKEALGQAHAAISDAEAKADALFEKLDADEVAKQPVTESPISVEEPEDAPVRDPQGHFTKKADVAPAKEASAN